MFASGQAMRKYILCSTFLSDLALDLVESDINENIMKSNIIYMYFIIYNKRTKFVINTHKTKVVIFRKGRRLPNNI